MMNRIFQPGQRLFQTGAALGAALVGLLFAPPLVAAAATSSDARIEYNRDVRLILSDNCFLCHGPDKNTRKAKLRLDIREEAIERGAIVPGKPDESELVKRIFTGDVDDMMPPPDSHKTLTAAQKETLKRWIAQGADYQPHWAYVKPTRPAVPAVKNRKWVYHPIDAFILHGLEARKLKPSPEADKRTLLRRLSLDLIGLPPTPAEMDAFLDDRSPNAYEKQVNRLLASPHYGERMAVPWLDVVRFSDTVGYHGDQNQRIFPYRDYVIAAFNRNKPFDQFTVEQLAGDLLPEPTVEQRIATGFNRLNMMTREGGAQPKEYLAKYTADRVRTVGATWLGSTMGCAECHDHKFDPITTRDFYSMGAFFADVKQWGVYQDYKYTPNPDLKDWSNDHPFPPELEVESEPLKRRAVQLRREILELFQQTHSKLNESNAWVRSYLQWEEASTEFLVNLPEGWTVLRANLPAPEPPVIVTSTNVTAGITNVVTKTNAPAAPSIRWEPRGALHLALSGKKDEEKIEFPLDAGPVAALRLERLPQGQQVAGIRISATLKRGSKETKIQFHRADASHKEPRYANGEAVLGILDGWKPSAEHADELQTAVWLPEPPFRAKEGDLLVITVKSAGPLTVRFAVSPFAASNPLASGAPEVFRNALRASQATRTQRQQTIVAQYYLLSTHWHAAAFKEFKRLQASLLECRNGLAHTLITEPMEPMTIRVLPRGNWQNENGEVVQPAPPHFLPQPKVPADSRLTRLDLARWLVSPDNPLTARVFVNRLWKQLFGTGISAVVEDLGAQGEWPVHPELLDWLSVEFMDSGWNVKHLVRQIVLSRTYRQQSDARPELAQVDPQNRWLAAQNPRRLEAEFVRDNALAAAGLLNLDLGGPSVRPYQPAGYYANLQFPDRDYAAQRDDRQYRRGVYMHWQRTFLHPMLANFDAPAREECTAMRPVSNTPQQALTLLNDPTFVEASRVFAAQLLKPGPASDKALIRAAFQSALGRPSRDKETTSLMKFLAGQRAHYQEHADEATKLLKVGFAPVPANLDPKELAAWTQVCRVVLNLHESVTRY